MSDRLPVSALVATRDRVGPLGKMLHSMSQQDAIPAELIVVDASSGSATRDLCASAETWLPTEICYHRANVPGAATQRTEGMDAVTQPFVLMLDDDICFESGCIRRLWLAIESDCALGGVNAMILNQRYESPGQASRLLFRWLSGERRDSWAGRCIGPAVNLLPEDEPELPAVVPVEWLNTTCTIYRREALPDPLFPPVFQGYSLLEDVALSLVVGRRWRLANARTARIIHESQPGAHKNSAFSVARMEVVNRHYIMTRIMGRTSVLDYLKLLVLQAFGLASLISDPRAWRNFPGVASGKLAGLIDVLHGKSGRPV